MDEYISKQRAKDLMGCCLTSAKANYKAETSVFKKEQFKHYAETIEAMIDVVGAVEAADVQPVKRGRWVHDGSGYDRRDNWYHCSECNRALNLICGEKLEDYPYCHCGARMDGEQDD